MAVVLAGDVVTQFYSFITVQCVCGLNRGLFSILLIFMLWNTVICAFVSICSWVTVTVLIVGNSSIRKGPLSIIQFNMIIVLLLHHLVYDVYVVVMFPFEIFY